MTEKHKTPGADLLFTILIVGRVIVMIGVWLVLFLMLFLGYFTVPILLIGAITLVYVLSDFGIVVFFRKQQQKIREQRQKLIDETSKDDH